MSITDAGTTSAAVKRKTVPGKTFSVFKYSHEYNGWKTRDATVSVSENNEFTFAVIEKVQVVTKNKKIYNTSDCPEFRMYSYVPWPSKVDNVNF